MIGEVECGLVKFSETWLACKRLVEHGEVE